MKLFWKIYIPVFTSFVIGAFAISYTISVKQISDAEDRIIQTNGTLVKFVTNEIRTGLSEGRLPFDNLKELSDRKESLFWWLVQDDGQIYSADKVSFVGTFARDYFPEINVGRGGTNVFLNHPQENGVYVQPFQIGNKRWFFWLGFSLKDITRITRHIILVNFVTFLAVLAFLGTALCFIINHSLKPVKLLTSAVGAIGRGDFSHRAQIGSGDELGELALSFNSMADNLQKTTVSKAYVDNIISTMKDPLIVVGPDRIINTVNEATCELLGFSQTELIGKPIDVVFAVDDCGAAQACGLETLFKDGEVPGCETMWKAKSGKGIAVLFAGSIMKDHEGRQICIVVTGHDISELKRVEEELRKSQERFRLAAHSATDLIYEWDVVKGRLEWFDSIDKLLGYAPDEFPRTFKAWEDVIHPQDHDRVMSSVERHLKNGEPYDEEYRVLRRDGSVLYWRHSGAVLCHEQGEVYKWVGAISDITKRRRGEEALRASEARNRLLIEESPVGIGIVQDGRFVYVNPSLIKILGFDSWDELVGKSPLEFVAAEERKLFEEKAENCVFGSRTTCFHELKGLGKNGQVVDMSIWPKRTEYLGRPAVLSFIMDTSEARNLRAQLAQAQKMEALGTLSGGIAHDFNNMLTIILGYSEMLLSEASQDAAGYQDLERVIQTARKGAELVRKLLAFSKQTTINPQPLNLNAEIEEFETVLSRSIPKMIEIRLELSANLSTVNADPVQIDQILMNLAINAKDAMHEAGRLVIETRNVSLDEEYCRKHLHVNPGDYVLLTISDTGRGMDCDTVARIFDPFFTTKERDSSKGTGLGLAVVKGIVEQHGGYISCYSEPDVGTSFKIYFPAIRTECDTKKPDAAEPSHGIETILLVDDDEFVRDLGERILTKAGYTVVTASDGKEALDLYATSGENISLVILDLIMPRMDGKQCLEKLLEADPGLKALIASGYSPGRDNNEVVASGAKGFVKKPYDAQKLLEAVRHVLDSQ